MLKELSLLLKELSLLLKESLVLKEFSLLLEACAIFTAGNFESNVLVKLTSVE